MKPRTAYFCFLCVFCCWTAGYPETYHQYTDKNGVICLSNSLSDEPFPNQGRSENLKPASAELQRAREQAEMEYWRAVEAKARSLRNTPDTEVHRKGRSSLQRRWETEKMSGAASPDRKSVADKAESKKVRYWKKKLQAGKNTPESEYQRKKRSYFQRENVALK